VCVVGANALAVISSVLVVGRGGLDRCGRCYGALFLMVPMSVSS
jgi:hypothetical protein